MIWLKRKHTVEISTYLRQKINKNREGEVLFGLLDHTRFPAHVPAWWVKSYTFREWNKFDYLCCWQQKPKHEYDLELIIKRKPESNLPIILSSLRINCQGLKLCKRLKKIGILTIIIILIMILNPSKKLKRNKLLGV